MMEKLAVRNPEFPMASTDLDVNVVKLVYFVSDANVCNLVEQDALKIAKQLFECQHLLLLRCLETSGGQSFNIYLNVVHFFNASVNQTSVAA